MTGPVRPVAVSSKGSLIRRLADNSSERSLATRFRRRRFQLFRSLLDSMQGHVEVLDVGGTQRFWELMLGDSDRSLRVTLLNIQHQPVSSRKFVSAVGDACSMPEYGSKSFDIVFSNSVIEHVGSYENQRRMSNEIRRIGERYFVQTPNKRFPLEPHFLFPWFQYLPVNARAWLVNHFDVGWYRRIADSDAARREVESIRLLTRRELTELFPGSTIYEERIGPLTKSFIAVGGWT